MGKIQLAEKLLPIFDPHRYKVIYGGRGGSRSWGVAQYLLVEGGRKQHRFLCTREVQKSIKDSVHKLLSDQIKRLGMEHFYQVLENEIRGINGTTFMFAGLSDLTVDSIKSYEGVTKVWCEEAQNITKNSWKILIPTIREAGSEIIVTFNPELETDETYRRFIKNTPPDTWLCELSWQDNPWFPEVLNQERIHCQETEDEEEYDNIWNGKCRYAVAGAIYAKEVAKAYKENRICRIPYDPRLKVHTVWDLGFNDSMSIILVQKLRSEIRIIDYIEDNQKTTDWYGAELNKMNLNWAYDWLPWDGDVPERKTGKSDRQILKAMNRNVRIAPQVGREEGIKIARKVFGRCVIDSFKCEELIECLKRYRRNINKSTDEPGQPVHDKYSHGADAFRYLGLSVDMMTNDDVDDYEADKSGGWRETVPGMGY